MKYLAIFGVFCLFALADAVFVPPRPGHAQQPLGSKQCTWGPSYWCQNLTAAADCHAVPHCIQSVWIHKTLPPDNSEVCQTCLDMVKQARDQLLSNDTQELIKEVFEGSCDLLHVKPIVKECIKIADNYIPELVDTLASQMNPQVVCHVAGLCNNERIHKLALEKTAILKQDTCEGCHTVVDVMQSKLKQASKDDVLEGFLMVCGKLGSFSDACSNIIVTYFKDIYTYLQANFNSNDVCLMAGECSAQFHTHVEITPKSHIGYVPVSGDDLPCELCEQLVQHLRELLIANTTEMEFKQVLQGLCKQTKSFKDQCLDLVDEYYSVAYNFLLSELNSTVACGIIGICPANVKERYIAPLLLDESVDAIKEKPGLVRVQLKKSNTNVKIVSPQLPIELLMPPHTQMLYNKETCVFCEYFLHFLQQQMTDPMTEDRIKMVIEKACDKLPASINSTCVQFVATYEPALIAILAQEIDPSTVCPLLKLCPTQRGDVEVFMAEKSSGNCPLCLYAVSELEKRVKDKKTEADIRDELNKLCSHLSANLAQQCNDFVQTYTDELVEMLVADFNPQEVCAYLKMCASVGVPKAVVKSMIGGDIETNMIPDDTVNGQPIVAEKLETTPQCILCEFIMSQIESKLKNNATDEEIEKVVKNVCRIMPKSVRPDCDKFMDENLDKIIRILVVTLDPEDACKMMALCGPEAVLEENKRMLETVEKMRKQVFNCAVCEATLDSIREIMKNPKIDQHYDHVLEKACRGLPAQYKEHCENYVAPKYGLTLIHNVDYTSDFDEDSICYQIGECSSPMFQFRFKTPFVY